MKEINEWLLEYLTKKWRSVFGLFLGILLIVFVSLGINIANNSIIAFLVICVWVVAWFLRSGRLIIPTNKYKVVFCIETDEKSERNYKKVLIKLKTEIDNLNLSSNVQFIEIAPDIIGRRVQAEKYRESQKVDLVIWGNAFTETVNGKDVVNFKLNFTCRMNDVLKSKFLLFAADLYLFTGTKKWRIDTDNTLYEELKVVNYFKEACIFIIGIYLLTDNKLEDALKIIVALKQIIPGVQDAKFQKFIQGRINSIIIEMYLLLGSESIRRKDYPKAQKFYLELAKYPINKFRVNVNLAKIEYYLGNLDEALAYTKKAAKENRKHPVIYANCAFFRILEKKYENALVWYKRITSGSQGDIDIPGLLEFLKDRLNENTKEYAYLFAIGLLNYKFFDKATGISDLKTFRIRTKGREEYLSMNKYSEDVLNAEKYRKKITPKMPKKRKQF